MGGKRRNIAEIKRLSLEKFGEERVFDFGNFNYVDMKTKGNIICPDGHSYMCSPAVHLRDDGGCRLCANKKISGLLSDSQEEWLKKASKTHGELYDYSKSVYRGQKNNIIITCRKCKVDFEQNPTSHVCGCGCPFCGIEKSRSAKFLTEDDILKILDECRSSHLIKYKYLSKSIKDGRLFINLECQLDGIFEQRLDHYRNGHGCVKCCSSISRSEVEWISYLNVCYPSYSLKTQYRVPSTNYSADAYCKELNCVFEYHGDFWHGNPKLYNPIDVNPRTGDMFGTLYEKTLQKHCTYEKLGYKLHILWELDWKRAKTAVVSIQRAFRSRHSK